MEIGVFLADAYGARRDLVLAGALLHDIGQARRARRTTWPSTIRSPGTSWATSCSGRAWCATPCARCPSFPEELALEIQHLVLSHHGAKELGSPVVPATVEALILAAADDFDAKMHQVRRHLADDDSEGRFTTYHRHLERVFLKPQGS